MPAPPLFSKTFQSADFFRIRTPRVANVPTFALTNVTDFTVARSKNVADTQLDHADQKKFWTPPVETRTGKATSVVMVNGEPIRDSAALPY